MILFVSIQFSDIQLRGRNAIGQIDGRFPETREMFDRARKEWKKEHRKYIQRKEYELSVIDYISAILLIVGISRKLLRIDLTFYKANNFKEPITFS